MNPNLDIKHSNISNNSFKSIEISNENSKKESKTLSDFKTPYISGISLPQK